MFNMMFNMDEGRFKWLLMVTIVMEGGYKVGLDQQYKCKFCYIWSGELLVPYISLG